MEVLYIVLAVLIIALVICIIGLMNLTARTEKQEDQIAEYDAAISYYKDIIGDVREKVLKSNARLIDIDIKGSFEADDEVGYVFKEIKSTIEELNKHIETVYE